MAVPFRPGRLSQEEYEQRKQQCTKEALASLQKSSQFKQWQQQQAFVHRATRGVTVAVVLLLATVGAASYHFWGGGGRPAALAAAHSTQNAELIQNLSSDQPAGPVRAGSSQDAEAALRSAVKEKDELQQQVSQQAQQAAQQAQAQQQQLADLQQCLAQQAQQAAQFEQQAGELQQRVAQQAQQTSAYQQQLGELQQELSREQAHVAALSGQLSAAEAELGRQRARSSALEAEVTLLRSSAVPAGRQQAAAPAAEGGGLGLAGSSLPLEGAAGLEGGGAAAGGLHSKNESAALPEILTVVWLELASPDFWSGLWVFYMSATMPLLLAALYRCLRPQRSAAGGSSGGQIGSLLTRLKNAREQVVQLEQEVQSLNVQLEAARAAAKASQKEAEQARQTAAKAGDQYSRDIAAIAAQLQMAEAAASARAAEAEQARQSLLQVQGELEERLRSVRDAALLKIAEAASDREELEEVHRQLEESQEWQLVGQQLLSFTAPRQPGTTATGTAGGASTPVEVRTPTATSGSPTPFHSPRTFLSPVKHSQLIGRGRPSSPMRNASPLRPTPIDSSRPAGGTASGSQSPAPASPHCADSESAPASFSEAPAASLEGDSPQGWLALLQARFVAAKEQGAAAERAGVEALLEAARRETSWSQQKVAEMVTDIELLKQRLADAKRLCERAVAGEAQAKEDFAALRARLEELETQAGANQQQQQQQQQEGPRSGSGVSEGTSQLTDADQQESMESSSSTDHGRESSANSAPQTQAEQAGVTPVPIRQKPELDLALAKQATPSSTSVSGSKGRRVAKLNTGDLAAAEMAVELLDEGWWSPGSARDAQSL